MRDQLLSLWPTDREVQACIKQEAEAVDEAVFLAVHRPMRFQRKDIGGSGETLPRSESDLLDEFLSPHLPEGRLILPIVGSSGVGKSHVIRWLDAELRRRADAEKRHIIRVPKGSSLKGVLRLLLQDLEGPAFERIREALTTARDHLESELAARQLQLNLRFRLERESQAAKQRIAEGTPKVGDKDVAAFGASNMLPALLGDPLLEQQHWLGRRDGKAGVLVLMAEHVTKEVQADVDGRRHQFVAEDLVLDDSIVLGDLSAQAQRCYRALHRDDSSRREQAARVLNLVLDDAKNDLLRLGDGSLVELFGEVRAELLEQGRELVFLVEDFAVLSGLQGPLLQVMITEATRDGRQQLCTMRTALAYTEGYMAGRDTVLTRARSEWLIEDRPGDDSEITDRIVSLVGVYLNAARVGQSRLKEAYSTEGRARQRWIPVVDLKQLEPGANSVAEAFGFSQDGHPLFPLSNAAIVQLARRGCVDTKGQLIFNPRLVINNVLYRVLAERQAFAAGAFPPEGIADSLRSADVTSAVSRRIARAEQLSQYLLLLRLWGGQPATLGQAAAMPTAFYRAFGLEAIDFGVEPEQINVQHRDLNGAGQSSTARTVGTALESEEGSTFEKEEQRWQALLESWAGGEVLQQSDARELRNWISDAVSGFLPTDALLLRPRKKLAEKPVQIYIPASRGQGVLTMESAVLVVATDAERSDPSRRALIVRTLMAFVRRYGLHKSWNYDGAEQDGGLVRMFLESREGAVADYYRKRLFHVESDTVEPLVQGLLVGARALGVKGTNDRASRGELVAALLSDVSPPPKGTPGAWVNLQSAFAASRAKWRELLLERVGARQGGAASVWAIDAATLGPALDSVKHTWQLGGAPPASHNDRDYNEFVRTYSDLRTHTNNAARLERERLLAWHNLATSWFGDDLEDKAAVQSGLRDLLAEVKARGLTPTEDFAALRRDLKGFSSLALGVARDAAKRLAASPSRGEVLSILAALPGRDLEAVEHFVKRMDLFLNRAEQELRAREAVLEDDVVQAAVGMIQDNLGSLEELLQRYEDAANA